MGIPKQITLDEAKANKKEHVSSTLQADTLFHFTKKLDWLLDTLKSRMLSPRYSFENIEDFQIPGLTKVAYPMMCFCDINLRNWSNHIDWYGSYGLAFSKKWGMDKGIQPIQYINEKSPLCIDMAEALRRALLADKSESESTREALENFTLLQIMYWKPYQGFQKKNSLDTEPMEKCFSDESEWRFIPDASVVDMPMIIKDENVLRGVGLSEFSDVLAGREAVSLVFCYEEVKHIILKEKGDYKLFEEAIASWDIDEESCRELRAKAIIWDNLKEDI